MDGNEYLDLACEYGASLVGHGNRRYNERLKTQIDRIVSVDQAGLEARVCERLVEHVPSAEWVRFGLSGTEVIQNALRLSRAYTGRQRVLRFIGHYHGSADNIMGGVPRSGTDPVVKEYEGDGYFTEGRSHGALDKQCLLARWNDIQELERVFLVYGEQLAAVLMEPVALNSGGILPNPGYLETVRRLCDRYGVVFILDEVITGFRMALGGAQSIFGIKPDLTILGKAMSGGAVPVSALVGRRDIMDLYHRQRVVHCGTFNGYPMGLAAVEVTMDLLEEDPGCYQRMGDYLLEIARSMTDAGKEVGLPLVVQGVPTGLSAHVCAKPLHRAEDYTQDLQTNDGLVKAVCEGHGIQFAPRYFRLYSNLMLNDDDVSFFKARIHEALSEARQVLESLECPVVTGTAINGQ
jgi:glutamate-1-semialdehyde aminotransferase